MPHLQVTYAIKKKDAPFKIRCYLPCNLYIIFYFLYVDERALVDGARKFNYVFDTRTPAYVEVIALGERLRYEILNVIEFTSARKRMSVIVKTPEGKIKLLCKGADSVIYERLCPYPIENSDPEQSSLDDFRDVTLEHLETFATDGLRTLCFAVADIPESFYQVCIISFYFVIFYFTFSKERRNIDAYSFQWWRETYQNATVSTGNRDKMIDNAANLIETKLRLLGATAIEDQLQDQVCDLY